MIRVAASSVAMRPVLPSGRALDALHPWERALLSPRATPKRVEEFAAGRRAAHAALRRLGAVGGRCAAVVRGGPTGGAPVAVDEAGRPLPARISITHAAGWAAALASPEPCGLDLVRVEPLERAFLEEAFQPGEADGWASLLGDERGVARGPCAAFAAKEAALKWLGTGLTLPMRAVRVTPGGPAERRTAGPLSRVELPVIVETSGARVELRGWCAGAGGFVLVALEGTPPPELASVAASAA